MSDVAVVTGSSGAIGGATCAALKEAGYDVVGLDRTPPAGAPPWRHRTAELTDPAAVREAFAGLGAMLLVNNAGVYLAREFLDTNAVAPGLVHSAMSGRIPADRRTAYLRHIPLGRFAEPTEIAAAITALAGPAGAYMTGSIVDVNGGLW